MTTSKPKNKRPKAIVLTSHPGGHGPKPAPIEWGAREPLQRGPLIGTSDQQGPAQRDRHARPGRTRCTARSRWRPAPSTPLRKTGSDQHLTHPRDWPVRTMVRSDQDRILGSVGSRSQRRLQAVLRPGLRHSPDHRHHARAHSNAGAGRSHRGGAAQSGRKNLEGRRLRRGRQSRARAGLVLAGGRGALRLFRVGSTAHLVRAHRRHVPGAGDAQRLGGVFAANWRRDRVHVR